MAITSITVGVTHNVGNYESVKIEATASICEECNYDEQKNELIEKLIELKELSKTLLNGNQLTTKPAFAPKPNQAQEVVTEPVKPTFAPNPTKPNQAQGVVPEQAKPTFAPKQPAVPKNPFAKKPEQAQQVTTQSTKPPF